jgi:hypothetical protein
VDQGTSAMITAIVAIHDKLALKTIIGRVENGQNPKN